MYYELVENSLTNRGKVVPGSTISMAPFPGERYISMFGFDQSIYEHLEIKKLEVDQAGKQKYPNGTVSDFPGNYFCNTVYFDVDNEQDPEQGLISARNLVQLFYNKLQVSPKHLTIAFSGSKGFHIGLHKNLFGGIEPSQTLAKDIQVLAGSLIAEAMGTTLIEIDKQLQAQKTRNYKDIDLGIYNANRIFRVINSRNDKSGLYKIGLTSSELFNLSLAEIKEMAKGPRPGYAPEMASKDLPVNETLQHFLVNARKFDPEAYQKEFNKGAARSYGGNFFYPPAPGNRNQTLFTQACMLFDRSDLHEESVRQLVSCINLASSAPLSDDEIRTLVRSASKRTASNEKVKLQPVEQMETFGAWLGEWVEYYTADPDNLSCIFSEFDKDNELNYKGKLTCLIGKGGSLKSFFAQNILAHNIMNFKARVLCSSMEMGKIELVNRLLNILFDPIEGMSASSYLRAKVRGDGNKEGWITTLRDTVAHIDSNLVLSNQSFMGPEDYEKMIEKTIRIYGGIDILVVDGLSAMGGKGTETEVYSRNSIALKELAKKYNIWIILICHVTKSAMEYDRDPRNHIRGSEKILDNADFFLSFSKLINPSKSTPENLEYERSYGHIKYYNKRGSGLTLNKIFFFEDLTNKMVPTDIPLLNFPTYEEFCREFKRKGRNSDSDPFA